MAANVHSLTQATAAPATAEVYLMLSPFGATDDRRITVADLFGATTPITEVTIANTGLHLADTDASHDLIVKPGSDLTADRILTLTTGDAARTLTISADVTLNQNVDTTASPTFVGLTLSGDLAVNGGDLTTTATTFNLLNATATTVNAFGAATTIAMGAAGSGLTTIAHRAQVGDTNTDQVQLTIRAKTDQSANVLVVSDPINGVTFRVTAGGGLYINNATFSGSVAVPGNGYFNNPVGANNAGFATESGGFVWQDNSLAQVAFISNTGSLLLGSTGTPVGRLDILGTLSVASAAGAVLRDF